MRVRNLTTQLWKTLADLLTRFASRVDPPLQFEKGVGKRGRDVLVFSPERRPCAQLLESVQPGADCSASLHGEQHSTVG